METLLFIILIVVCVLWVKAWRALKASARHEAELKQQMQQALAARDSTISELTQRIGTQDKIREGLVQRLEQLSQYSGIVDAATKASDILSEANDKLEQAQQAALQQRQEANQAAKAKIDQAEAKLWAAGEEATRIIAAAKQRAEEIAGDAYAAMNRAKEFSDTVQAMKNLIEGYGDAYIVPTYSLLDDLAEELGYVEAGQKLKEARDSTRALIKAGRAATCEYVEANRKETAVRFVTDAFNGKVDSILSRSKADNHGKLEQEIRDAYAVVNHNGAAFRNATITPEYLESRLNELKWAAIAHALREQEREEQRQLREQMREEERARREYERAIKDAAKEEETIRKAMEKVQQQVIAASEAQRAEYEAKLRELETKLQEAEEKNQRALSMAQQTRTGHVYVISNIGSFGEEVFKIGMTRRLEPSDRIRELGDASVPFEFDIHAMIYSEDAPGLEKRLHRHFLRQQMNKVNPRKEFFRLSLNDIRREVEHMGIAAHWTMTAEALNYRESLRIEQNIRENPALEKEWTRHQLELEPSVPEDEAAVL